MAQMRVDGNTTIQQLQQFSHDAGNSKVRGRDNGDGTYTLYTSNKGDGTGFKNFFGKLDNRRNAARSAIDMVFQQVSVNNAITKHERRNSGFNAGLDGLIGANDLRGNALENVADIGEGL